MSRETDELIKGHEYDGIQEFNNPLPGWWSGIFVATIIFAAGYWYYYEMAAGPTPLQEMTAELEVIKGLKKAGPSYTEESLAAAFTEQATAKGKEIFIAKCAACHTPEGAGLIGPNLTDKFWINGTGSRLDIVKMVTEGVPAKGMPVWADQISPDEIVQVSSFVFSLKGTNVPNGKPPQGTEYP